MKVFVTGASGFVGREVLQKLHDAGHGIRILARHSNSASVRAAVTDFGVEVHAGDILNPASLESGLQGINAVIHLVGIISEIGNSTFENVHVRGTENVVTAAKNAGVRRLVHMSALGTRPDAVARYHKTKWQAEEIVRHNGLDYTIFRPSIIYGPRDHFVNLFAQISRFSPMLPIIGSGQSKLQPVPVSDVATCFVKALKEPQSIGQTYDLCGADVLSFENILEEILRVTGRKRLKVHLPVGLARAQAAMLESVFPRLLGRAPPLNRDQIIMLDEDNVGNAQPANELFGLKPIPFREGISAYLKPA
jgi:uncharacterized protein YbjT (DUF2867 family)